MEVTTIHYDLAPLFYLDRVFFVLPFSKFDSRGLQFSFKNHLAVLSVQMSILLMYVFFIFNSLLEFLSENSHMQASEKTSFAIFLIFQCIDVVNIFIIMTCCLKANSHINYFLQNIRLADRKMPVKSTRKTIVFHLVIFFVCLMTKLIYVALRQDKGHVLERLGPRLSTIIIMASEQTLIILCLQLRKRLVGLNSELRKVTSEVSPVDVKRLRSCFDLVTSGLAILSERLGPFLLFNLAQLFMMSLCSLLFSIYSCNTPKEFQNLIAPVNDECTGNLVAFLEVSLRFCLIIWACSSSLIAVSIIYSFFK